MAEIIPVDTPSLGDRSYLVTDGKPVTVLDVCRRLEWAAGHLAGARHIPLHELPARLAEAPGTGLWVHCQSGYRPCVAASRLQASGRQVIAIDDEFSRAAAAGLPVLGPDGGQPG